MQMLTHRLEDDRLGMIVAKRGMTVYLVDRYRTESVGVGVLRTGS